MFIFNFLFFTLIEKGDVMKISKLFFSLFIFTLIANKLFAQADAFSIKFVGFIKTDAFYQTRQMVSLREDHITLWPSNKSLDKNGEDLNEVKNFHILSIQTRLGAKIDGPGIFGGKTSGYVETEFLGTTEADINSLRLRHAYVDFIFDNTTIRAGQFWHPIFSTDNFPDVLNFNTGIPFIPFNRSPQIKITQKFDKFSIFAGINTQRDFTIDGPDGYSPKYVRNSIIPEASFGVNYSSPTFVFNAAASAKTFQPYTAFTIGGLGLTGIITWARFKLQRCPSPFIAMETIKFDSIEEFFEINEESEEKFNYTVAWVDTTATGANLGRGLYNRGNHANSDEYELPKELKKEPLPFPFDYPFINNLSVNIFNILYYNKQIYKKEKQIVH